MSHVKRESFRKGQKHVHRVGQRYLINNYDDGLSDSEGQDFENPRHMSESGPASSKKIHQPEHRPNTLSAYIQYSGTKDKKFNQIQTAQKISASKERLIPNPNATQTKNCGNTTGSAIGDGRSMVSNGERAPDHQQKSNQVQKPNFSAPQTQGRPIARGQIRKPHEGGSKASREMSIELISNNSNPIEAPAKSASQICQTSNCPRSPRTVYGGLIQAFSLSSMNAPYTNPCQKSSESQFQKSSRGGFNKGGARVARKVTGPILCGTSGIKPDEDLAIQSFTKGQSTSEEKSQPPSCLGKESEMLRGVPYQASRGNPVQESFTRTNNVLRGGPPRKFYNRREREGKVTSNQLPEKGLIRQGLSTDPATSDFQNSKNQVRKVEILPEGRPGRSCPETNRPSQDHSQAPKKRERRKKVPRGVPNPKQESIGTSGSLDQKCHISSNTLPLGGPNAKPESSGSLDHTCHISSNLTTDASTSQSSRGGQGRYRNRNRNKPSLSQQGDKNTNNKNDQVYQKNVVNGTQAVTANPKKQITILSRPVQPVQPKANVSNSNNGKGQKSKNLDKAATTLKSNLHSKPPAEKSKNFKLNVKTTNKRNDVEFSKNKNHKAVRKSHCSSRSTVSDLTSGLDCEAKQPRLKGRRIKMTKVIFRLLPPDITKKHFLSFFDTLPPYDYFCIYTGDPFYRNDAVSTAWINFLDESDALQVVTKYRRKLFYEMRTKAPYISQAHFASNQYVFKKPRKSNPKRGTITESKHFQDFLKKYEEIPEKCHNVGVDKMAEEIEIKEAEAEGTRAPLVEYLLNSQFDEYEHNPLCYI